LLNYDSTVVLQVSGGLVHADLGNRLVPTLVPRQQLGAALVGRCHGLREELALAFAMGTHQVVVRGLHGRARERRKREVEKEEE
jgi:hypothetical protein